MERALSIQHCLCPAADNKHENLHDAAMHASLLLQVCCSWASLSFLARFDAILFRLFLLQTQMYHWLLFVTQMYQCVSRQI